MNFRESKDQFGTPNGFANQTLGLDWVVRVLMARRFLLAVATALGVALSLLYLLFATPLYVGTTQIAIEDRRPRIASGQEIVELARLNENVLMLSQVIDSQIAMIQAPQQIEKLVRRLKLFEEPDASGDLSILGKLMFWRNAFQQPEVSGPLSIFESFFGSFIAPKDSGTADGQTADELEKLVKRDKRLKQFFRRLSVSRLNRTSIILVSYADTDRERAAKVANAVAEAYIDQQVATINKVKREAVGWLKARATELQEEVLSEEGKIEEYKVRNNLISVDGKMLIEREIMQTVERLVETRAEAASAQARAKLFGNGGSDAEVAKLGALIQEKDLRHLIGKLASATDVMVGLRELELKHKATRDVYTQVLTRLKEGEVQKSLQTTQSRIVNYATPPLRPKWPRKTQVILMGAVGSAWLAVTFVLLQEFQLGIVRSPKDIRQKATPVATLPLVRAGQSGTWLRHIGARPWRTWLKKLLDQLLPTRSMGTNNTGIQRQTSGDMASPYAQAMFKLTKLMDKPERQKGGRIFALVSSQEGEGKTMTAFNLADYAASAGKKVLLIDADLRRPALTETCAPLPILSLVDIAEQKVDAGEVFIDGIFDFCPGPHGKTCQRPMEVLASENMSRLLQHVRADYDLVLIDTSPLLAYVDATAFMKDIDGILMIVECGRTTQAQIDGVLKALGEHCDKLVGVALNKTRRDSYRRHYS